MDTIPGQPYGQDFIPRAPTRVCIGLENPAWAGPLDPNSSASVTLNSVEIIPFQETDTQFPTLNDQPFAEESDPNGTQKGGSYFALPHMYPQKQKTNKLFQQVLQREKGFAALDRTYPSLSGQYWDYLITL